MIINKEAEDTGSEYTPKEIYLGKALYNVIGVNPNKEELKEMNQYVPNEEPSYVGMREIDGKEYPLANITVYLQNVSDSKIVDRVTYSVIDNVQVSSTGKTQAINKYGSDAWIEESHINAKTLPSNMQWYVNEGVKPSLRGEKELIRFIRALRNFKNVTAKTEPEEKEKYASVFERADLDKLFKGDFKDIKSVIMSSPDSKVGFLLGARTVDEEKTYQDIYKEYPMRRYMVSNDNNDYLIKEIRDTQDNGRYPNSYFDLTDLKLKKYNKELMKVSPDADSAEDIDDLPF